MRIIFLHLDYSGSLVIVEADTLEGRRERLAHTHLVNVGQTLTAAGQHAWSLVSVGILLAVKAKRARLERIYCRPAKSPALSG